MKDETREKLDSEFGIEHINGKPAKVLPKTVRVSGLSPSLRRRMKVPHTLDLKVMLTLKRSRAMIEAAGPALTRLGSPTRESLEAEKVIDRRIRNHRQLLASSLADSTLITAGGG